MSIEILRAADAASTGLIAAALLRAWVDGTPQPRLGVATGASPVPLYLALAGHGRQFHGAELFLLDEYVGLDPTDPRSYRATIQRDIVDRWGLADARVHSPAEHGERYDDVIAQAGGIAVQILGIGANGHLAFNEPGTSWAHGTHEVALTEQTRRDNARYFDGDVGAVPTHAVTQGIATILRARRLLVVAIGSSKAEALAAALLGPVDEAMPASALQRHGAVTVVADPAAAASL